MAAITLNTAGGLTAGQSAVVTAQFQPLDPGVVSAGIPAFFIGRNKEGFWVARDVHGQIGGIFLLEDSAVSFARRISGSAGCATIFPSETIELDLENSGNPLLSRLGSLMRLANIKQFCVCAFSVLLAMGALAGIIALKAAFFLSRLNFHH